MRSARWAVGVAGAAGLVAGATLAPVGATAAPGDPIRADQVNTVEGTTTIARPDGPYGPPEGYTVKVENGLAVDHIDLFGVKNRTAIQAVVDSGTEAVTVANMAKGQYGGPGMSVQNQGPNTAALVAVGFGGRAASFYGKTAQLQLQPYNSAHPKSGARGDLFVDKDGKLWFCKGGTSWKQIA